MRLLIDADFIVYKCCAACETEIDYGEDVIFVTSNFSDAYNAVKREIQQIQDVLKDAKTKIVLYVYDSILLDVDKSEKALLAQVKQILEQDGFKVGLSYGNNYNNLKKLN